MTLNERPAISRHFLIAVVVAPILALLAWFLVGEIGAETPQRARAGQSYPLEAQSNCRYASGVCDLENVELTARLIYREDADARFLQLDASHALSGAIMSVGLSGAAPAPLAMSPAGDDARRWVLPLLDQPDPEQRIRLVLSVAGSKYFVETSTAFLH
ncbi:Uncharacterised protein [Halioglobus japonicus]|nr:Uncharacterised protein [Halioglobus japonicus]